MPPRQPRIHPPGRYLEQRREELEAWAERERRELDREYVRQTASCPRCKVDIGERCRGTAGNHQARTTLAISFGWRP